jgi:hypothetical protein
MYYRVVLTFALLNSMVLSPIHSVSLKPVPQSRIVIPIVPAVTIPLKTNLRTKHFKANSLMDTSIPSTEQDATIGPFGVNLQRKTQFQPSYIEDGLSPSLADPLDTFSQFAYMAYCGKIWADPLASNCVQYLCDGNINEKHTPMTSETRAIL